MSSLAISETYSPGKPQVLDTHHLLEAAVGINISWYRHLKEADQETLCAAMRSPQVCRIVCVYGWVTLLLKNHDEPVHEASPEGITISSHISKLEPLAFYALATATYERARAGP